MRTVLNYSQMRAVATLTAVALVLFATGLASFAAADEGGPTVTLSSTTASSTNADTIAVTAQFSEEVSDFDAGSVTVTNGTVDNVATTTTDNEYTFDVTPSAEGDVTVQIAENAVASASSSIGNVESNTLTFTSDVTAPTISDIAVSDIGTSTATISWTTDEPTTGSVSYGTDDTYGASTTAETTATTSHSAVIDTGLSASGTYHYQITATDEAGNSATSEDATFDTADEAVSAPQISDVMVDVTGTSTATISFSTDVDATGFISYGTDDTYGASTTMEDTASTTHSIMLSGLDEGTVYHYQVSETNSGGTTTTDDATFVTRSTASSTPLAVTGTDSVKSDGVADNQFADGWKWMLHFTVPDNEDAFRIRFSDWGNATSSFAAEDNMRLSIAQSDNASTTDAGWVSTGNDYSDWFYLSGDADASTPGRQVDLSVEVKIPFGTANGSYTSNFTAQTYPQAATSTATD
jgi:hypothetical protein